MNSNQRSQVNNQTSNGGNEKDVSSSRGGTVEKGNIHPDYDRSQQSGMLGNPGQGGMDLGGLNQQGGENRVDSQQNAAPAQSGTQAGSRMGQSSTDRTGSQTGIGIGTEQQAEPGQRQSNDLAGGYPRSPGTHHLAADQNMDDDTGLSNRANHPEIDEGSKQMQQSNVGRRSDMTPD